MHVAYMHVAYICPPAKVILAYVQRQRLHDGASNARAHLVLPHHLQPPAVVHVVEAAPPVAVLWLWANRTQVSGF